MDMPKARVKPFLDDTTNPTDPPVVHIRQLKHYFMRGEGAKPSLDVDQLDVYPGEIVIMTGPSGSGKTTLLTLIGALRTVQEGNIEVLKQELHGLGADELVMIRRGIGFIFQAHNLFASLSAFQNVCMALQLHGWESAEADRRATEVLTALGLGNRIYYKPGNLSGGQKQRVAIARAISNRPGLILADEPTAALDAKSSEDVVELLHNLARHQKAAILLVTHDNRILNIADRIVNMVDGRIVSDVQVNYALKICNYLQKVEVFKGLPADALLRLAEKMQVEKFEPGQPIIRQGEALTDQSKFYILRRGTVDVLVKKPGEEAKKVRDLEEGAGFGEIALITGGERTASVIARDAVETWTLDRESFQAAVAASDSFKDQVNKLLFQRQ